MRHANKVNLLFFAVSNILYVYHLQCKEKDRMKEQKKFDNLEDLRERVVDLSWPERQKQETANEIQKILLWIVNEKNEKAEEYEKDFKNRVNRQVVKRERKQGEKEITLKYGSKNPDLKAAVKYKREQSNEDHRDILKKVKEKHQETSDIKNDIFEILKRAFNKEITMHQKSDIDKEASLFLLKKSGFLNDAQWERGNLKDILKEVPEGESGEKWLTIDTWGTVSGMKVNKVKKEAKDKKPHASLIGSQVIISEHSDMSEEAKTKERPTSSAHMIFHMLDELDQLPQNHKAQLQRFINFIDIVDSLDYQISGMDYKNNHKTLFGLYRNLKIEDIYRYFENPSHTGFEILPEWFLKSHKIKRQNKKENTIEDITLETISKEHEERIKKNIDQMEALENSGQFWKFNGERFMIALGDEVQDGAQVASYFDYWLIKIYPKSWDFYMYSPRILPEKILDFNTDGNFLTEKNITKENLEKLMGIFEFNEKEAGNLVKKVLRYYDTIHPEETIKNVQRNIKKLPEREISTLHTLKKEETAIKGIINNVNGKNIYINISPTLTGLVKLDTKKHERQMGDEIQVKIDTVPEKIKKIGENEGQILTLSFSQ